MPATKLTNQERREMILALLSGESASKLAKKYSVARSWVYAAAEEAKKDPRAKLSEAQHEANFRLAILHLLTN